MQTFFLIIAAAACHVIAAHYVDKAAEAESFFVTECRAGRGDGSFAEYLIRRRFARQIAAGLWTGIGMYVLWSAAK